jgi:hypothetical protein
MDVRLASNGGALYSGVMEPSAALALQVARYREMTGEERVTVALELLELACDIARAGIRARRPGVGDSEVERLLAERLRLALRKP